MICLWTSIDFHFSFTHTFKATLSLSIWAELWASLVYPAGVRLAACQKLALTLSFLCSQPVFLIQNSSGLSLRLCYVLCVSSIFPRLPLTTRQVMIPMTEASSHSLETSPAIFTVEFQSIKLIPILRKRNGCKWKQQDFLCLSVGTNHQQINRTYTMSFQFMPLQGMALECAPAQA